MTRLVRHILNRTTTQRTISKQECMVLLSQIPLVMCSEIIKTISISDSRKLSNKTRTSKNLQEYIKRSQEEESLSYAEFFQKKMNSEDSRKSDNRIIIPHFVGLKSNPTYPVTADYARATLIINKPWRTKTSPHLLSNEETIEKFQTFITSAQCPRSVKLSYLRVKKRFEDDRFFAECAKDDEECFQEEPTNKEDALLQEVITKLTTSINTTVNLWGKEFHKGLTYEWGKRINEVSIMFELLKL